MFFWGGVLYIFFGLVGLGLGVSLFLLVGWGFYGFCSDYSVNMVIIFKILSGV